MAAKFELDTFNERSEEFLIQRDLQSEREAEHPAASAIRT